MTRPTRHVTSARVGFVIAALAALVLPLGAGSRAGSVAVGKPEDVGMSSERLRRVTESMQAHVKAGDVAGVVTLVARRGRIAHFEAQGSMNLETRTPMAKDAIFRLASMSKPITGVAVLMLLEEGKIRLADPVSRFIPEFKSMKVAVARPGGRGGGAAGGAAGNAGPGANAQAMFDTVSASREITVRDLLTHTSGLVSGGLGAAVAPQRGPSDTLAGYIPKLGAVPLDFQPGTLWRYSGQAGFDVLSRIVEIASGLPFDQFLKQRLFDPLGMKDTTFVLNDANQSRIPVLYQRGPKGLQATPRVTNTTYFSGAGGLASTAEDYLQFAQMLLNRGQMNGVRFLSPKTIDLMTANHTGDMVNGQFGRPDRGMGFGLSVQVVQDPAAADLRVSKGSYGWAGGTGVSFWIEPEDQLVSIFFIQGAGGGVRPDFENAVRQAIVD
jgi:CubicO group peptidase (beta-lactamase class C family)